MVMDQLSHADAYYGLHELMEEAFAFLRDFCKKRMADGRYELRGDELYAIVSSYRPAPKETPRYESHDRYIDIQCIIAGSEYQWYVPREQLTVSAPYQKEKDITFYQYDGTGNRLHLTEGSFAIYFPQDAHLPAMEDGCAEECTRIVVKIKCAGA